MTSRDEALALLRVIASLEVTDTEIEQSNRYSTRIIFEKGGKITVRNVLDARALLSASELPQGEAGVPDDSDDAVAERFALINANQAVVEKYVKRYEWDAGDDGYHVPNDGERVLIEDAIQGLLADDNFVRTFNAWQDKCRAASPAAPEGNASAAGLAESQAPATSEPGDRGVAPTASAPSPAPDATAPTPEDDEVFCEAQDLERSAFVVTLQHHRRVRNALQAKLDAATRYAEVNPLGGPATMFEAIASRIRAGEDYYAVLRDYGLMQDAAQSAPIDRGDAVNLARTIRETDNIENVTRMGWLSLVDAVLRLDAALAAQSASAAMPKDVLDTLRQARKECWYEENHGWDKVDAWLAAPSPDEESKR